MAKTKLQKIILNNSKISDIEFEYDRKTYTASITPSEIHVKEIGLYDRKKGIMWWALRHCCGAQGFGYSSNDTCPACESKTGVTLSYIESGVFAPSDFPQIMKYISKECNRLEKSLQRNGF